MLRKQPKYVHENAAGTTVPLVEHRTRSKYGYHCSYYFCPGCGRREYDRRDIRVL